MKLLSLGKTGPYVELLQSILKKYGFYTGNIDGIFGPLTHRAVTEFKTDAGLNPDGIVGSTTWGYLTPWINGYVVYKIQNGDTFFRLAEEFSTDVRLIIAANPNADPDNLPIGQEIIVPLGGNYIPTDISYTYSIMNMNINSLLVRFPFLETEDIGKSVLRKNIRCLKFGKGEKSVMYNASHHANEWITTVVLMRFIEELSDAYAKGEEIYGIPAKEIYDSVSIYFIPMVNPDGVNLVTGELTDVSGAYQYARKITPEDLPFPSSWAANIRGVDLNSNYPARWEEAKETKFSLGYTAPGPAEYVGPEPLSEPETKAMAQFTRRNDFSLTLSYHTQGEVIFYRFGEYDPPMADEIAQILSKSSGYVLSEPGPLSAYAGYKDWFIQEYNRPAYTIECGTGTNPLPISQFEEIYSRNRGILTLAAMVES